MLHFTLNNESNEFYPGIGKRERRSGTFAGYIAFFFACMKIYTNSFIKKSLHSAMTAAKSLERKFELMALLASQKDSVRMIAKENEPRTATRSGITSHNTFDRGEGRERPLLCTALRFNGAQITAHRLLQVVKAGHFKSFSKVSALGYPVFLTVSLYSTIYMAAL